MARDLRQLAQLARHPCSSGGEPDGFFIPSSSSSSGVCNNVLESSDSTALVSSAPEGGVFVEPRSKR
jgi:hypothetical protein